MPEGRALPRVLRLFDISVLASASMGPAYSIAATMGPMVAAAGTGAPLALIVLSAIMFCIATGFASLSRVAPNAGSSYSWIREAFGSFVGAYGAWLLLLSNFFATLAIAVPAGSYTLALLDSALASNAGWTAIVGAGWIAASGVLLYVGVRPTALVTFIGLGFEVAVMMASALAAALHPQVAPPPSTAVLPLPNAGAAGFLTAVTLSIWMSDGWEVSASTSEEVDDTPTASGRGGIAGLIVSTAVLVLCMLAYQHIGTTAGFIANQSDALAYVGDALGGAWWRPLIVITVLLSTLTTLWTTLLYLSRSVFAMGRDRVLTPSLGALDSRNEPLIALAVVTLLSVICMLITGFSKSASDQLTTVINASSVFLGLLFVLSAAASVRRFWATGSSRLGGVLLPLLGGLALLGVLAATIGLEEHKYTLYACVGLLIGVPFSLWRGRA